MINRPIATVILIVSALILFLEISIFVSVLPSKLPELGDYKKQVNSTLSDKEFVEQLISQNIAYKTRIDEIESKLADQELLLGYMSARLNMSLAVETNPFRRISKEDIRVYNDRVIIYVNKAFTACFSDSKSMYPFINEEVYALEVPPEDASKLNIGDVIGYDSKTFNTTIIHRIIEIGEDEGGWFAITKGDNNPVLDPDKVRFEDVKGVLVGLIY
ncbi:signal peptidase I [Candidatus Woesearchaeota archaeon]|nr:signal peptidase I [Candidatus Woesearchaeota archaeon]